MDERRLRFEARKKVALALLALAFVFAVEVAAVIILIALDIPEESLLTSLIPECLGGAAAVVGVMALGGRSWASVSRRDVGYAFRFGWWCLAVSLVLMGIDLVQYAMEGTPTASDWLLRLGQTALLCLAIGIFEECVFRGIVFHGLLATMGGTHEGLVRAVFVTSVIFGAAHVDFGTDFVDALSVIQAVLKMVQTGIYSVLLCVIALRTHRLGGVSLYHALDDFLLIFPSVALFNEPLETEYVVQGDEAVVVIIYYLVVIALYLPLLFKALRELRRGQDVYRGAFMERAMAEQERAMAERQARADWERAQAAQVAEAAQAAGASESVADGVAPQAAVGAMPDVPGVTPQAPETVPAAPAVPDFLLQAAREGLPPIPDGLGDRPDRP